MPTNLPATSFQPISVLSGTVLLDEPNGLSVTFGRCIKESSEDYDYITFVAVNRDQFDESSTTIQLPAFARIASQGKADYVAPMSMSFTVGPGQVQETWPGSFWMMRGANDYTHVVIYWPDGKYDVYTTNGCMSK